jgi:hypothetical protein
MVITVMLICNLCSWTALCADPINGWYCLILVMSNNSNWSNLGWFFAEDGFSPNLCITLGKLVGKFNKHNNYTNEQ